MEYSNNTEKGQKLKVKKQKTPHIHQLADGVFCRLFLAPTQGTHGGIVTNSLILVNTARDFILSGHIPTSSHILNFLLISPIICEEFRT